MEGFNIEHLRGEISRGDGVAKSNLFRVIFPVIPAVYINLTGVDIALPQNLNVLCENVSMPSRLLTTVERTIGVVTRKVAYGFVNEDITMTFLGLNNYVVRKYFENWQNFIMDKDNHGMQYHNDYAREIIIQQLNRKHEVVNSVFLEDAFPVHIQSIELGNLNSDPVKIGVTLTYSKWRTGNVLQDGLSTVIQREIEKIIL